MKLPKIYLSIFFLLPSLLTAQDASNMACDFESGMNGWSGTGKIITDETGQNKVYSLKKTGDKTVELSHPVTVPKNGHVEIRFRVRGMPGGKEMRLRKAIRSSKGSGFFGHKIEPDGKWSYRVHGSRDKDGKGPFERTLALVFLAGEGEIQIDDIQVTKGGGPPQENGSGMTSTTPGRRSPPWNLTGPRDYRLVGGIEVKTDRRGWLLEKGTGTNTRLETNRKFAPPFRAEFQLTPTTDSSVRILYAGRFLAEFNLGSENDMFKLHLPGISSKVFPGGGRLTRNRSHKIEFDVQPDSASVSVDGEKIGSLEGSYSQFNHTLGISPFRDNPVLLEKFSVFPGEPGAPDAKKPEPGKPPTGKTMSSGRITGNQHASDIPLKRSQTRVNGLLVLDLGNTEHAGAASPMTLSALRGEPSTPSTIQFNQEVGPMMSKALEEVVKFIELRHDAWPKGRNMEISFENKYNPKDGPSAAVACALLLESSIMGHVLDSGFAVTGDMNADGSVQPVGGIDAKIRGADLRNCTHVAIPVQNETSVYDTVVMEGLGPVSEIQVFTISDFAEADKLAREERAPELQESMTSFEKIAGLYRKAPNGFARTITHPKVIALLEEILEASPNHLSAQILLEHARGQGKSTLSLHGSTEFIEKNAYSITDVIDNKGQVSQIHGLSSNRVVEAISLLRRSRDRLDQRTWNWANGLINFGTLLNTLQTNPPNTVKVKNRLIDEINAAGEAVRAERVRLFQNPEVMEELLQ